MKTSSVSSPVPTGGEELRDDLRPIANAAANATDSVPGSASVIRAAGSGNAAARRLVSADELAPLTRLNDARSLLAIAQTFGLIGLAIAFGLWLWPSPWLTLSVLVIGVHQHALFILAHESAHYRLLSNRTLNDRIGRAIGMLGAISMHTYRVVHRLHHNNLYTADDPDTAIHGGYPRGNRYLWQKLAQDLVGWNAWKTFAYFFGAPALSDDRASDGSVRRSRPLDDTSPQLRATARADRWWVIAFQLGAPVACALFGGWRGLAQYAVLWVLPLLTVLQPILRLRAICEHGAVDDLSSPLTAARTNRTWGSAGNWLARSLLFPHHVNYHLEHHLYPAVPHYHLPRLHRLLLAKGVLDGAEVRDQRATHRLIFAPRRPRAPSPYPA